MTKILISISNRDLSKVISLYLNKLNISTDIANDGIQALVKLQTDTFDYLIIENDIVRLSAKEVLDELKEKNINIFTICIKNKSSIDYSDLIDNNFDLIVPKPFNIKSILDIINEDYNLVSEELILDSNNRNIKYEDSEVHLNVLELLVLKKITESNRLEINELESIFKELKYNMISNYVESLNYKLNKIKYLYNIKPIEKGYELVKL